MKQRILTLCLHPNGMQKRYMIQQWNTLHRLYQEEGKHIAHMFQYNRVYTQKDIFHHLCNAKKQAVKQISDHEIKSLCNALYAYQNALQDHANTPMLKPMGAIPLEQHLYWRHIDMFKLVHLHHAWQKEVFRQPWLMKQAHLQYQRGIFYLTLTFYKK